MEVRERGGLTTSQFATAPKPALFELDDAARLTTSQFVTAPKLGDGDAA